MLESGKKALLDLYDFTGPFLHQAVVYKEYLQMEEVKGRKERREERRNRSKERRKGDQGHVRSGGNAAGIIRSTSTEPTGPQCLGPASAGIFESKMSHLSGPYR